MPIPVEHMINGDNQVAIFVECLPAAPAAFRRDGEVKVWLDIPGEIERCIYLPAGSIDFAVAAKKLLIVEVDRQGRNIFRQESAAFVED